MNVTLIAQDRMNSLILPVRIRGQFWLSEPEATTSKKLIGIEAVDGKWILKSNSKAKVLNSNNEAIKSVIIEPSCIYRLRIENETVDAFIFTEPDTDDRRIYKKFIIENDTSLKIGRNANNDIVINIGAVSSEHANIIYYHNKWKITDNNSTNGTFVNGYRVNSQQLNIGDVVFIMGLKIIIGSNFIALNNPDGRLEHITGKLCPFVNQETLITDDDSEASEDRAGDYFYRSPRFKRDIDKAVFKIDSPPQNAVGDEIPMILLLGPSISMGMASIATAFYSINNAITNGNISNAMPSIVMSSSMLLGTVLWPILSKRFEKKRKHKKEELRQKKYKDYLDRLSGMFDDECAKQEEILRENYVPISDCVARIQNTQRNLWERGPGQNDFLTVRVGEGNDFFSADISYSERRFSLEEDNLLDELYALCEKPKILRNVPITLSLFDDYISGVIGERFRVKTFIKGIVFQLAAFYSYDEVKMVFLYDKSEENDFEFAKWLPHVWDNDKKFRFLAADTIEAKEVSAFIERELDARAELNENDVEDVYPYYLIFALDKTIADRTEMFSRIFSQKQNLHFSVIHVFDSLKNLPKECTMVVELEGDNGRLFDKNDISGKTISFIPDISLPVQPNLLSIKLSNIQLDSLAGSYRLPGIMTFLEMYGVGKVEHLNPLIRWKENDPTKSLGVPIGVNTMGELLQLDLHEKFHGPHGLVAGMTGSGKSELIIAYILSLAVNFHPYEVAFILIDYKGGGMAKSFEKLPHTAGIITNLDGAAIKRSLISIESELKRRQAIFAKTSKEMGISNLDIYKYQRLYREGGVSEPLQHLFIISDEFAELKTQQPEFMEQLVSAARIGRSLGVHLILATQKPSGVVDDQIWSNSRFRVCLKVQERSDSSDMLKRPDAAELIDTGRFYLQVGYNEIFEMGQSAWAGAAYLPSEKVVVAKDDSIVVVDHNGRAIREAKIENKTRMTQHAQKQLDAVTDYICQMAEEEKIKIRPLWLEPIPAFILLADIRKKYEAKETPYLLQPVVGEYDEPANQRQSILRVPLSDEGNVVIFGAAGSGKTTFLDTLLYSLISVHTPDEVHIYLLDFAAETLRAFAKAPHVGDFVLSYETEKVNNLLKMMKFEIDSRKKNFADFGGDYQSYLKSSEQKLPAFVVVINNYAAFIELYEEKEEAISYLTREGAKFGVYFILTASSSNTVRYRLMQNFRQVFVLQMNDQSEYTTILGRTDGLIPSKHKGRGLVKLDNLYEFQVAHVTDKPIPYSFIHDESVRLNGQWNGKAAPKIPILPQRVDDDFLSEYIDKKRLLYVPIGVEKNTLRVFLYPFAQFYINPILSAGDEAQQFLYDLSIFLLKKCEIDLMLVDASQYYADKATDNIAVYSAATECESLVQTLFDLVLGRNNLYKETLEKGNTPKPFETKVVLINSITALKNVLSEDAVQKLNLILEKGDARYGIHIIFSEQSNNVSALTFDKWYKNQITSLDGIWVGNGISEQYQLRPNKTTSEMRDDVAPGFGFVVQKGKAVKMKLLCSIDAQEEEEEKADE